MDSPAKLWKILDIVCEHTQHDKVVDILPHCSI